jgi:hypothetical protein
MEKLTPDQIQAIAEVVQKSAPGPTIEQIGILVGIVLSVLLIMGVLVSVIRFIARVGAVSERIETTLITHKGEIDAAHDKFRQLKPIVDGHKTDIAVLRTEIDILKELKI